MSSGPTVPARTTVSKLAEALNVDLEEVQAVLAAGAEPGSPEEVLDAGTILTIAKALGARVHIEPRDVALETLYEAETSGIDPTGVSGRAKGIVEGVLERRDAMDEQIENASEHWSVTRMPAVDRSILRIGLYELLEEPDIPTAVIVSEAVRLAKTYSTERSGSFVNGVLAALAREVRGETCPPAARRRVEESVEMGYGDLRSGEANLEILFGRLDAAESEVLLAKLGRIDIRLEQLAEEASRVVGGPFSHVSLNVTGFLTGGASNNDAGDLWFEIDRPQKDRELLRWEVSASIIVPCDREVGRQTRGYSCLQSAPSREPRVLA